MFKLTQEGFTHAVYNGTCVQFESDRLTSLKTKTAQLLNKNVSMIPGSTSLMSGTCKAAGFTHEFSNPLFKKQINGLDITAWLI